MDRIEDYMDYWRENFNKRCHPKSIAYVGHNKEMLEAYLKVAKECGAVKSRICEDGAVIVFFNRKQFRELK